VRENERPQTANFEDARVHSSTYTNQVYIMYIYLYFTCIQMKYIVGIDMYIIRALAPWLLMLLCWKISVYRRPFLERGPSIYSFSYGNQVYIRNIYMYIIHILAPSFWMELCERISVCRRPFLKRPENKYFLIRKFGMGWLRLVGSLKLYREIAGTQRKL